MTISSIEHKVALITGAGAGIGAEVARRLADAGAQLLLVDKDATALNSVRRQIGDHRAGYRTHSVRISW
jgi:NADP-dependent 3-hydroxy acid dehydrogenase YdfG